MVTKHQLKLIRYYIWLSGEFLYLEKSEATDIKDTRQYKRGVFMSCLTRSMQKQLSQYIKRNIKRPWRARPEKLRNQLVTQGICPSDVTQDQFSVILELLDD